LLRRDADEFHNLDLEYGKQIDTLAATRSDADGRFAFPVARARQHRLFVLAPACAPTTVFGCTGGAEVVVRVGAGAVVEGVVRAELHVRAQGCARGFRSAPSQAADFEADFALGSGGRVRGRFVEAAGAPACNVYAACGVSIHLDGSIHTEWLRAIVAADGRFE